MQIDRHGKFHPELLQDEALPNTRPKHECSNIDHGHQYRQNQEPTTTQTPIHTNKYINKLSQSQLKHSLFMPHAIPQNTSHGSLRVQAVLQILRPKQRTLDLMLV